MRLLLEREPERAGVTLGRLYAGRYQFATLERPWIANPAGPGGRPSESCVPEGVYWLRPHDSERFPGTYALVNEELGVHYRSRPSGQAWGRTAILIHVGNRLRDVIGCIAIGRRHAQWGEESVVVESTAAMNQLRAVLGRAVVHEIEIVRGETA